MPGSTAPTLFGSDTVFRRPATRRKLPAVRLVRPDPSHVHQERLAELGAALWRRAPAASVRFLAAPAAGLSGFAPSYFLVIRRPVSFRLRVIASTSCRSVSSVIVWPPR